MTQTFTQSPDFTAKQLKEEEKIPFFEKNAGPSSFVIQNILNFSKNLEIKHSKLIVAIELIKS